MVLLGWVDGIGVGFSVITVLIINLGSISIDVSVKHWQHFLKDKRSNSCKVHLVTRKRKLTTVMKMQCDKCFPRKEIF